MTMRYLSVSISDVSGQSKNITWRDLVIEAEALALSGIDSPLHISALCDALSVSDRTLRKAFHNVHGASPCRHLRMQRLAQARRALLSSDSSITTVTEVATCYGFPELGRFSVEYRSVFGEKPSETLKRASQAEAIESPPSPGSSTQRRKSLSISASPRVSNWCVQA